MTIKCITANLQGGQDGWLNQLASEEIDIAFLQEAPHELPKEFADAYDICKYNETAAHPAYRCRTLIAVRREASLNPKPLEVPTATYHRSYVAGARVDLPGIGETVLVSIHASPREIPEDSPYRKDWSGKSPTARPIAKGVLWDSDYVFETIRSVKPAKNARMIVAGDFNEARGPNLLNPEWGIWGTQYFEKAESELGLIDVTWSEWKGECATHGDAQLDHILATEDLRSHLMGAKVLQDANKSDHKPITWSIT
jgi:hypothetical protein